MVTGLRDLPEHVFKMIESGVVAEFSTVSSAGVAIDTPTEEPVVVVRAHAAVRDRDIQSNAIRYLAQTDYRGISHGITWEEARKAITYWSRIIIENTPERIYWWDNRAHLDAPPQVWNASAQTRYPASDPAPQQNMKPSAWPVRPWQEVAADALASGRTGLPWTLRRKASLTFAGFRTFVGTVETQAGASLLQVERALPQHPSTLDTKQLLKPSEDTRAKARARLEYEAQRRGQSLPVIPSEPPARTRIALIRMARIAGDPPITGITAEHGNRMS